jgi:hypothetical protein
MTNSLKRTRRGARAQDDLNDKNVITGRKLTVRLPYILDSSSTNSAPLPREVRS